MTRRLLPFLLPMMLLAPAVASAQSSPAATNQEPAAQSSDGWIAVTRSDGSTGRTRAPDAKDVRKLVGYIRDGMNRADLSDAPRQSRKANQYKHDNRSRR